MTRSLLRFGALAAAAASIGLAGCVSVLPKNDPSQLYSFVKVPSAPTTTSSQPEIGLLFGGLGFPRAAGGDGVLTRNGVQAAYIADARWVGPASVLFREATENVFDRSGALHLVSRGEVGRVAAILRIDVKEFEARYPAPDAAPSAVVSLEARLNGADGTPIASQYFSATTAATDNRVGPIVDAYAASTDKALSDAAAWVEQQAASLPPSLGAVVAQRPATSPSAAAAQR